MIETILNALNPKTKLCIAADITLPEETIITRTVRQWKSYNMQIGKRPCVFLILADRNR